jgi:hypothetical protein
MFYFDKTTGSWYVAIYNGQDYDLVMLESNGERDGLGSMPLEFVEQKIAAVTLRKSLKQNLQSLRALRPVGKE